MNHSKLQVWVSQYIYLLVINKSILVAKKKYIYLHVIDVSPKFLGPIGQLTKIFNPTRHELLLVFIQGHLINSPILFL